MSETEEPVETVNPDASTTDETVPEGEVLVENEGIGSDTETLDSEDEYDLAHDEMVARKLASAHFLWNIRKGHRRVAESVETHCSGKSLE